MSALVFVYIIEEADHTHVQNAPLERLLSIPWLVVMLRLLSEIRIYPVIDKFACQQW